jgi:hypothetical protein
MGTLGPDAALEADCDPALLPALADAAFGSSEAREEGLFLGSFPERRSTIVYPIPADPVIFEPNQDGSTSPNEHDQTRGRKHARSRMEPRRKRLERRARVNPSLQRDTRPPAVSLRGHSTLGVREIFPKRICGGAFPVRPRQEAALTGSWPYFGH